MKRAIIFSFLFMIVAIACTKKAMPTVAVSEAIPAKTITTEPLSGPRADSIKLAADIPTDALVEQGKSVYAVKCSRCHVLRVTGNYTMDQWDNILKKMIPNAKLTAEEEKRVVAYIRSEAKK